VQGYYEETEVSLLSEKYVPYPVDDIINRLISNMIKIVCCAALFSLLSVIGLARPKPASAETQIRQALDSTSAGWNRGNLPQYLGAYTPYAREMGPDGPRGGVEVIENTMKNGFWKTGRPLQILRYEHVDVRMLGKANALVTGQYVLSGGGKPDRSGWFTTVWAKTKDGWRMIFDHS
jgi:ketosteroid isomerase-like protein